MPQQGVRPKINDDRLTLSGDRVFFSIQGEGASIGLPAVFLRLHLCNLSCSWCDTPYTWNEKLPEFWDEWKQFSIPEVAAEITQHQCKRLVITGGEPLLQQDALSKLIDLLPEWEIEVETNGTVSPIPDLATRCQFNVSPKLANSGISLEKRIRSDVIKNFLEIKKAYFKFVVASLSDLEEVKTLSTQLQIPADRIILMPEGTDAESINNGMKLLAEPARDLGFRLLPRMHVQIWGNKRRV